MSYTALVVTFFLANGLCNVGLKVASGLPGRGAVPLALLCAYLVSMLPAAPAALGEKRKFRFINLWVGALGGMGTCIGSAAVARAVAYIPGHIVFPITGGGTLLLISLAARIFFKEKIGPYGVAGMIAGGLAITLLN
jgi:drug/metabolite transporter (DMT)-like permease